MLNNEFERVDNLYHNNYKVIQDKRTFCYGTDAVFLSFFSKFKKNAKVLDLCSGNGAVALLICATKTVKEIYGLEINEQLVALANRSAILNHIEDKLKFICGDLKEWENYFENGSFDHIVVNPPYRKQNSGFSNENELVNIAKNEVLCSLCDVVVASYALLKSGGKLTMVHRADRLSDVLYELKQHQLEPKRLILIQSKMDKKPHLMLVEAVKDAKSELIVEKNLLIYQADGTYTDEIKEIYFGRCEADE